MCVTERKSSVNSTAAAREPGQDGWHRTAGTRGGIGGDGDGGGGGGDLTHEQMHSGT